MFKELKEIQITPQMPIRKQIVKSAFEDANNYMKDGILLRQVINVIDEVDFNSPEDRHLFNDIYETILKEYSISGGMQVNSILHVPLLTLLQRCCNQN